jgi:hypothetical protein
MAERPDFHAKSDRLTCTNSAPRVYINSGEYAEFVGKFTKNRLEIKVRCLLVNAYGLMISSPGLNRYLNHHKDMSFVTGPPER